jgi:hypothetical protein
VKKRLTKHVYFQVVIKRGIFALQNKTNDKRSLIMKSFLLTGFIFLTLASSAFAQKAQKSGAASQTLNIFLGDVIDIRFISNDQKTGPLLQMTFNTADDYFNGIESPQQTLKVRSNKKFSVSVRAVNTLNGVNHSVPPFIYLKVPQNHTGGQIAAAFSNTTYQKLSNNNLVLLENANKGDDQNFSVQYKARPGTIVDPGVYNVDVVFTASPY